MNSSDAIHSHDALPTTPGQPDRALHILAILTAAATFPLIFIGGLVTSHGAGLAVPDWPNSYGYNMFLFPPRLWIGGIFYEHTHRLWASAVGMLSIALAARAFWIEKRAPIRRLCYAVLACVIFQGILGGLRVVWKDLDLAIVHACFAQAFFCLASLSALATSSWWARHAVPTSHAAPGLFRAAAAATVIIYLQLVVGAVMRHNQAGLAIPDFPTSFGSIAPPTHLDEAFRLSAMQRWNDSRLDLGHVTLFQIWIQFAHRLGAVAVFAAAVGLVGVVLRQHRNRADAAGIVRGAILLIGLVCAQIVLGGLTVLLRKPADLASLHVAVGALTLVTAFLTTARTARMYGIGGAPAAVR